MYKIHLASRRFCVLTLAAFLALSYPVLAQDGENGASTPPPPYGGETVAAKETAKSDDAVFLPEASIQAQRETAEHISQEQMTERGDTTLFEAIRWIPGIVTTDAHPGSGLGGLSLRGLGGGGHGADYLTIMQDGTPLTDMDGGGAFSRIDYAGIQTGGLESIDVAKGYTSVLLGPNIMAGALMMRTAKPKRLFELNERLGMDFDAGGFGGINNSLTAGTRLGIFYARAGIQERYVDHWRLPDSFKPNDTRPATNPDRQGAGNRLGTNENTLGANIMLGANPLESLDVWATYGYSSRTLLSEVETTRTGYSDNPSNPHPNFVLRSYPYRNRHDATLHGEWTADSLSLGLHGYFNISEDRAKSFSTPGQNYSTFWSAVDENTYTATDTTSYTFGINLDGAYEFNEVHKLAAAVQFKQNNYETWAGFDVTDNLPEHTDKYRTRSWQDNIYFGGVEYTANPTEKFTAIAGLGIDMNDPLKMDNWLGNPRVQGKSDASNLIAIPQWSLGAFYDLSEKHEVRFTYAKKNRFATLSQRSGGLGTDTPTSAGTSDRKPNLDLKPQQVHHFEIGYKGYFLDRIRLTSALYTNYELDKIANVNLINDPDGYDIQSQNIDKYLYYGLEFGTEMFLNDYFTFGGSFSINKYKILHSERKQSGTTNPDAGKDYEYMGASPLLTTNGYISISPFGDKKMGIIDAVRIMPRFEYVGTRLSTTDSANLVNNNARIYLDDYVVLHLGVFVDIAERYQASFAVHNLLDELYYFEDTMPRPGRSFNLSFGAKF